MIRLVWLQKSEHEPRYTALNIQENTVRIGLGEAPTFLLRNIGESMKPRTSFSRM